MIDVAKLYLDRQDPRSRDMASLVAVGSKGLGGLLLDSSVLLGIGQLSGSNLLALVVGGTLGLSSLLQSAWELVVSGSQNISVTYRATTSWYFQPTS